MAGSFEPLPDAVAGDGLMPERWEMEECGCRRDCLTVFNQSDELKEKVRSFRGRLASLSRDDKNREFHDMLSGMAPKGQVETYQFLGVVVCQNAWLMLAGVSKSFLTRRLQILKDGGQGPPPDLRSARDVRAIPQRGRASCRRLGQGSGIGGGRAGC